MAWSGCRALNIEHGTGTIIDVEMYSCGGALNIRLRCEKAR